MQADPVILISRTDSIGDVILTLPMTGIIKSKYPNARIYFLGKNYTKDVIESCEHINKFISIDELKKLDLNSQIDYIKKLNLDYCIHVLPNKDVAILMKKAGVKFRIGTTNRLFHWLTCNKLVKLSRKKSNLHEAQLNTVLLRPLGLTEIFSLSDLYSYYGFKAKAELRDDILNLVDLSRKNIILHPKSQGSAREWGLENFGRLAALLDTEKYKVFVSGTEKEKPIIQPLLDKHPNLVDITGKMSLYEFIAFIGKCDALVAASTGPLHIASALGKYAVGLFPSTRPMHPGRWQPVGKNAHVIMLKEDCEVCKGNYNCTCGLSQEPQQIMLLLNNLWK